MALRLKPAYAPGNAPATVTKTEMLEVVATESASVSPAPMPAGVDVVMMKESGNFMTRHYLWAYILVVIIVLVIIFWFAVSGCRPELFDNLQCKSVEWVKGSSGRVILGLFLAIALLLLAWGCAHVSGMYRCMGDMNRANIVMGVFGVLVLLVLITFVLFFRGSFHTAYCLALLTLLIALLVCIMFCYYKFTGGGLALGLFTLWALFTAWVMHKVSCQNPSGKGHGGSGSGSPQRVVNRSPH